MAGKNLPARATYPWRCLCLGFSQITRKTRPRLTNLHLAHIFFTEERTFILTLLCSLTTSLNIDDEPEAVTGPATAPPTALEQHAVI
jgi:hypothetical protein